MHKLVIPATLIALAGAKCSEEAEEFRQLRQAEEDRAGEIEFICSDVLASMGFSHQGKQEDNSAVNCELVFGDNSSTNDANRIETMQRAADYVCVAPEVNTYRSKQPTPKKPICFIDSYPIDFSSDNALFNANSSCSDFEEPPANTLVQDRWCNRIEAVVADVREGISFGDVMCSCVHAEAVVTDEFRDEIDLK